MLEQSAHESHWHLRSLLAAALLSVCALATAMSVTVNADRAAEARRSERAIAQEAELVADLASFLAEETAEIREELAGPRIKPAPTTSDKVADFSMIAAQFTDFDFSLLADARRTTAEKTCLAQAIYYEARSEPRIGQLAVADVILNRVSSSLYPDTICEVVFQGSERRTGCQFSFTCDGSMERRVNARKWAASEDLAGAVLAGLRAPVSRQATHYHADYVDPYWAPRMSPTAKIGVHKFYRFPSRRITEAAPSTM